MAKFGLAIFPMFGSAVVFPDVLVPVLGQPKLPSDLIGTTMNVPSERELENHLQFLGANPTFTKHMEVFEGAEAMNRVASQLQSEIGLAMSTNELYRCAREPSCLQVWTTADAFIGKTVRITKILGSWSMSAIGVGNVCHVNAKHDVAYCHLPSDAYKSGLSWLALGVPVDAPLQEPLPVAVRCHDMGPNSQDAPCHLLSGNEFMAAQVENMDTHLQSVESESQGIAAKTEVVSLGWSHPCSQQWSFFENGGGTCLDVPGGTVWNGAPVQMWPCNELHNQEFVSKLFSSTCNPYESVIRFGGSMDKDTYDKYCLDVPGGNFAEGQTVWLWECDDSASNQKWSLSLHSDVKHLTICPNWATEGHDSCWCLEGSDDGSSPFITSCSDSKTQSWSTRGYSRRRRSNTAAMEGDEHKTWSRNHTETALV